jgi:hypothetical protein
MSAFEIEDKEFHNILPSTKIDGFLQKPFSISKLYDILKETGKIFKLLQSSMIFTVKYLLIADYI